MQKATITVVFTKEVEFSDDSKDKDYELFYDYVRNLDIQGWNLKECRIDEHE